MKKGIPENWWNQLTIPAIAAPMFLVSGPDLVSACCKNGVIGSFPAPNARPIEVLDKWMGKLNADLEEVKMSEPDRKVAPWAMNMVVHSSYSRLDEELELLKKHKPQLVITSLGSPKRVVEIVHEYGGLVFSDVSDVKFARKAAETGVDGLILVASGAGGHAGELNSFAFVDSVRTFWDGIIVLAGAITTGKAILASQAAGADLAYMGTRFIVAKESMANDEYRQMVVDATQDDLLLTDAFSGVKANMLKPSIIKAGLDPETLTKKESVNFDSMQRETNAKAWKDIWSAGQGVGAIRKIESAEEIIGHLEEEYKEALTKLNSQANKLKTHSVK
ncbi:nitronate monooxygenase [Mesobacillus subterraneus]|jgi:nitronate monooxygenase|uniref:NAD(P)H-dependent flavin oxidoreductase n=1 Tax=Mesobacillus subterraneus TaxID=285983 RepID=UPI0020403660|nr:nitronate monooxygenase [Mesobacillus subterraneus]MCM3664886.1 nitronate monooxygenase [Mesobacillus subterraneus]MCM3681974.1 nitronate monooxygenase [Mesobacillus subterraneus]